MLSALRVICSSLLLGLVAPIAIVAQDDTEVEAEVRRQILAVLEHLSSWGSSELLIEQHREDWFSGVDFALVLRVLDSISPESVPPSGESPLIELEGRVVVIDTERSRVRYINRLLAWNYNTAPERLTVSGGEAIDAVGLVIDGLGLPANELAVGKATTQVAESAPAGSRDRRHRFEMYRIVTFERRINGIRVSGSIVRAAVNDREKIQRLMVVWPAFRLPTNLVPLDRNNIVDHAVSRIMERDPGLSIRIRGHVAYVPRVDLEVGAEKGEYLPAIVLSVTDLPTHYQVRVPVAAER